MSKPNATGATKAPSAPFTSTWAVPESQPAPASLRALSSHSTRYYGDDYLHSALQQHQQTLYNQHSHQSQYSPPYYTDSQLNNFPPPPPSPYQQQPGLAAGATPACQQVTPSNHIPEPLIDFESDSPPANAREFPAAGPRKKLPVNTSHLVRLALVIGAALILILLTMTVLFLVNPEPEGGHVRDSVSGYSATVNAELPLAGTDVASTQKQRQNQGSAWIAFGYNFTTSATGLGTLQREPAVGTLAEYIPGFRLGNIITQYSVCCQHSHAHLICTRQSDHEFPDPTQPFDVQLSWTPGVEPPVYYLKMTINSEAFLNSICFMGGMYSRS